MKQLEIKTNKKLLIVEGEFMYYYNGSPLKYICKGSDLTEDIAEGLVNIFDLSYYVDYNGHSPRCYVDTALESFISAIEAAGYYWKRWNGTNKTFEEAESRTFNPSKCIIFEIL